MKKVLSIAVAVLLSNAAFAANFGWVNGKVTSFTAQQPAYTVAIVNNKVVRFCNAKSGKDYVVDANNLFYDMLKTALETKRDVQVGVNDFGFDPQSGGNKMCIDRVILVAP